MIFFMFVVRFFEVIMMPSKKNIKYDKIAEREAHRYTKAKKFKPPVLKSMKHVDTEDSTFE